MKRPLRSIVISLVILVTAIAAFSLTVAVTSDNMDSTDNDEGIEIDLDQNPYETATTEDSVPFWGRIRTTQAETSDTEQSQTTQANASADADASEDTQDAKTAQPAE